MKSVLFVASLAVLILAGQAGMGQENKTVYEGHGMRFEYPSEWTIQDSLTGVIVGDLQSFMLSITMHDEGCYPLLSHPQLMDYMLKLWGDPGTNAILVGTPWGEPITQFIETEIGPYSIGTQLYENPHQILMCELQSYPENNVTIAYANTIFEVGAAWKEANLNLGRLKMSLVITENQTSPLMQCNDSAERTRARLIETLF